jgi:hypothetical protein
MEWRIGALANFVTMVAYLAICAAIFVPLIREQQLRANRLGTATGIIFFTCAVHHGAHTVHMLLPSLGVHLQSGLAMRQAFDVQGVVWDLFTAAVGIYYWTLRRTYGALMSGAKLFDDLRERQRQALEINDGIVQGLATAKLALELDQTSVTREALGWMDLMTTVDELLVIAMLSIETGWTACGRGGRVSHVCQACGLALAIVLTLAFAGGVGHV